MLFIHEAGSDQHTLGTDADLGRAMLDGGDDMRGQPVTNAVELGKGARRPTPVDTRMDCWNADWQKVRGCGVGDQSLVAVGPTQDSIIAIPVRHQPNPARTPR
jgi:hypothetical protein